jgi:hypothetical protein
MYRVIWHIDVIERSEITFEVVVIAIDAIYTDVLGV